MVILIEVVVVLPYIYIYIYVYINLADRDRSSDCDACDGAVVGDEVDDDRTGLKVMLEIVMVV